MVSQSEKLHKLTYRELHRKGRRYGLDISGFHVYLLWFILLVVASSLSFHQVGMNQTLLWMGLPSSASLWRKSRRDTGRKKTNLRRPSPRICRSVPQIFLQSVSPLKSGSFLWLLFFLGASASLASAEEMSLKLIIICTLLQTVDNCFIVVDCLPYICGFLRVNFVLLLKGTTI